MSVQKSIMILIDDPMKDFSWSDYLLPAAKLSPWYPQGRSTDHFKLDPYYAKVRHLLSCGFTDLLVLSEFLGAVFFLFLEGAIKDSFSVSQH